jgi:hypothetical protein
MLDVAGVITGTSVAFTLTDAVADALQLLPAETVTLYVALAEGVIVIEEELLPLLHK